MEKVQENLLKYKRFLLKKKGMVLIWLQVLPSFASFDIFVACFTEFIETKFYILYSKVYVKTKYEDEGLLKHTEELLAELGPGKGIQFEFFQIFIYETDK